MTGRLQLLQSKSRRTFTRDAPPRSALGTWRTPTTRSLLSLRKNEHQREIFRRKTKNRYPMSSHWRARRRKRLFRQELLSPLPCGHELIVSSGANLNRNTMNRCSWPYTAPFSRVYGFQASWNYYQVSSWFSTIQRHIHIVGRYIENNDTTCDQGHSHLVDGVVYLCPRHRGRAYRVRLDETSRHRLRDRSGHCTVRHARCVFFIL